MLPVPENPGIMVDIDSALSNRDRINSKCPKYKHPFYHDGHGLQTVDRRIPPHIDPLACEYDIRPNNIPKHRSSGFTAGYVPQELQSPPQMFVKEWGKDRPGMVSNNCYSQRKQPLKDYML